MKTDTPFIDLKIFKLLYDATQSCKLKQTQKQIYRDTATAVKKQM